MFATTRLLILSLNPPVPPPPWPPGYGAWLHGEAVAAGTMMAADMSQRLGWIDEALVQRIRALNEQAKLPVAPPPVRGVGGCGAAALRVDEEQLCTAAWECLSYAGNAGSSAHRPCPLWAYGQARFMHQRVQYTPRPVVQCNNVWCYLWQPMPVGQPSMLRRSNSWRPPACPALLQTMTVEQFRNTMAVDKKVQDGKLRLILLK